METVEELKRKADEAECKITEVIKECKDEEGGSLGLALGSSIATELGFALNEAKAAPKNVWVDAGILITHAWRFVTHGQTLNEIDKALKPSCETQLKRAIQDLDDAKERWHRGEADMKKMKNDYDDYMDGRKKLQINFWDKYQGSLKKYATQREITEYAMKEYAEARGMATIYSAPPARVYSKERFEKIWGDGHSEFKKILKS